MQYTKKATSKYLTHAYASYYGCTKSETWAIAMMHIAIELPLVLLLAGVIQKLWGGYFFITCLTLAILFGLLTIKCTMKIAAEKISKLREGQAEGYLHKAYLRFMHKHFNKKTPFVSHQGQWSIRSSMQKSWERK